MAKEKPHFTVLVATDQPVPAAAAEAGRATVLVEPYADRLVERAEATQPDVILVDLGLPGLNTNDLLRALRSVSRLAEVIVTRSLVPTLERAVALRGRRRPKPPRSVVALGAVFERLGVSRAELDHLASVVSESAAPYEPTADASGVAERLAGPAPSKSEAALVELRSLERYFDERRQLLRGSLTTDQVAKLLGTSRQTPHDRVKAGTLLALSDAGKLRFPHWQFDAQGDDGVVGGLPQTIRALRVGPLASVRWLTNPNRVFEGRTPLELLRAGEVRRVVAEAAGVGAR
jgi:CheY-like chemotaxis protein